MGTPKFKKGDHVRFVPLVAKSVGQASYTVYDPAPTTKPGGGLLVHPTPQFGVVCSGCGYIWISSLAGDWEHYFELDPTFHQASPIVQTAFYKAGDRVRIVTTVFYGHVGTVQRVFRGARTVLDIALDIGGSCGRYVEEVEPENVAPTSVKPASPDKPIEVRPAHANPKHPKLPCCGWCGEPVLSEYGVRMKFTPECPAHGKNPPIVQTGIQQRRHP